MEDMRAVQMMIMSLALIRGGGTAGALGGLGGILSGAAGLGGISKGLAGVLGPVGFGLTALGGVFGLFDNNEERRHRELVRTIERMGQEVGLDRVTVVFTGPDGHQVRRSLAELEESDAVERVPGPVGAGG
jgi:sugar phosphate isomerase/epimerase